MNRSKGGPGHGSVIEQSTDSWISVNLEGSSGLLNGSLHSVHHEDKGEKTNNKFVAGNKLGRMVKMKRKNKGLSLIRKLGGKSEVLQLFQS